MLAAVDAGWRPFELALVLGMQRSAVAARVYRARRAHGSGIVVPAPEVPEVEKPLAERRWLRAHEVREVAGISPECLDQWRHDGLLPATRLKPGSRAWYARADLERILAAHRRGKTGVDRAAVRALIAEEAAP